MVQKQIVVAKTSGAWVHASEESEDANGTLTDLVVVSGTFLPPEVPVKKLLQASFNASKRCVETTLVHTA